MDFDFGQRLRTLRREAGLSQDALALLARLSKHTIVSLENGHTERPHPATLRKIEDALQKASATPVKLRPADGPISISTAASPAGTEQLHAAFNAPDRRALEIAKICPEIANDPEEMTRFVSYDDIVSEFSWLRPAQYIQTTTLEYMDLWNDPTVFINYEATLLQFKEAGRPLNRLFIVDATSINIQSYRNMVARVLFRHWRLGFDPRIIINSDVRSMHKDMRLNCAATMFFDAAAALILVYTIDNKPLFLSSNNLSFCTHGSNIFRRYWSMSRDTESFLKRVDLPPSHRQQAEREVGLIQMASTCALTF